MIKQVIVVRKYLNMRKGKIAAQVAHASMKVFFDNLTWSGTPPFNRAAITFTPEMKEWVQGIFIKIVVSCNSENDIIQLEKLALEKNIPCAVITDSGATEFHGVPTVTCIAIGPDQEEKINELTEGFSLL